MDKDSVGREKRAPCVGYVHVTTIGIKGLGAKIKKLRKKWDARKKNCRGQGPTIPIDRAR